MAQLYSGTKILNATPMTRADYNRYRGWTLPASENGNDPGYLVEYLDGGKPNHPEFSGYISWSPADVFERTYKPCVTPQQRLAIERGELEERLGKLAAFLTKPKPDFISATEWDLLNRQSVQMANYLDILAERMELHDEK